jgi:hypothetical protein
MRRLRRVILAGGSWAARRVIPARSFLIVLALLLPGVQVFAAQNPPGNCTATVVSDTEIDLSWTAPTTSYTNYQIYTATGTTSSPGTLTVQLAAGTTSYAWTGRTAGTTYSIQITDYYATTGLFGACTTVQRTTTNTGGSSSSSSGGSSSSSGGTSGTVTITGSVPLVDPYPELTNDQGAQIGAALLALWAFAFTLRIMYDWLRKQ